MQRRMFFCSPPPSPAYVGEYCSTGPKLEDLYNELEQLELNPPLGASDEIPAALKEEEATHIFENYSFDHTYPSDLPITRYQQQIVDTIESNSVTIVQGLFWLNKCILPYMQLEICYCVSKICSGIIIHCISGQCCLHVLYLQSYCIVEPAYNGPVLSDHCLLSSLFSKS